MKDLMEFCRLAVQKDADALKTIANTDPRWKNVYGDSIHAVGGTVLFIARTPEGKRLWATGAGSAIWNELDGKIIEEAGIRAKICILDVANSQTIRKYFSFANPQPLAKADITIGLGDRLGLASAGHIRLIKGTAARPVLAQQSMRELNLTGRNYPQVLADAVWAVFQEDYRDGYGADGDHLKTAEDIQTALDTGFTMITLDCSEHIANLTTESPEEVEQQYLRFDATKRQALEGEFLGKVFRFGTVSFEFTPELFYRTVVIYQKAIDFAIGIYHHVIAPAGTVDFEVSIDETLTSTHPAAHFFVAEQLVKAGVKISSMAPRFCGEFQKGIDYRGDITQFEREYREHEAIAAHFGYKVSIHSGSDKFMVFPIIGATSKRFHLKTAGTNWLEAVRVIIEKDPALYREIHAFALEHLAEAKKYYHISADPGRVPALEGLGDAGLKELMNQDDARQVIHITYGLILQAMDEKGELRFRPRIYRCLEENESSYYDHLRNHIGKHLELLKLEVI